MSSVENKETNKVEISPKTRVTKSRTGCLTCKKKRIKCDETKPVCINCTRKKIICGGYSTKFKWRVFNDGFVVDGDTPNNNTLNEIQSHKRPLSVDNKHIIIEREKKSKIKQDKIIKKHIELASLSVTGKSIRAINKESEMIEKGLNPSTYNDHRRSQKMINLLDSSSNVKSNSRRSNSFPNSDSISGSTICLPSIHRSHSTNSTQKFELQSFRNEFSKGGTNSLDSLAEAVIDEVNRRSSISSISDQYVTPGDTSPCSTQILFPQNMSDILNSRKYSSTKSSPKPLEHDLIPTRKDFQFDDVNSNTPSLTALINYAFTNDNDKLLESGIRLNLDFPFSPSNFSHSQIETPSGKEESLDQNKGLHMTTSLGIDENNLSVFNTSKSPISNIIEITSKGNQSLMRSAESEQILYLYSKYTCTIMSIKNGPNENPWRKLIIPSALNYPCLYNSIASMTLFHLAGFNEMKVNSHSLREKGYMHMKKCILELASGLSKVDFSKIDPDGLPCDIALATCLNLTMCETWDTHTSSGIAHLKGAKSLIQKALHFLKEEQSNIYHKRLEFRKNPTNPELENEYNNMIRNKRILFKNKLALLSDHEWEKMLADNEAENKVNNYENENKINCSNKQTHKSNISIPKSLQFFFNHWIYFEVLSQITTDCDDKGIDLVATITSISEYSKKRKSKKDKMCYGENGDLKNDTSPTIPDSTDSNIYFDGFSNGFNFLGDFESLTNDSDSVDPLLGCGQGLFMIMGKVANLISKIRKIKIKETANKIKKNTSRLSFITTATQLRQQLIEWKPIITPTMLQVGKSGICDYPDSNSTWDIHSCIVTGEAYRYATLLYLHQAVPEIPSLSSHQLAEKVFVLLASIPMKSHTYVLHIFPLLISSCEAETLEERNWCESRWSLLSEKMWIGNIDRSLEVVREVWRRKDKYKEKKRQAGLSNCESEIQGSNDEHLRNISTQISGLMAIVNNDQNKSSIDEIHNGITSYLHWSTVMKEWGWEVLLG